MQYRELGRTGWTVSTISFGAWAIGGSWGSVDDKDSLAALERGDPLICGHEAGDPPTGRPRVRWIRDRSGMASGRSWE